MTNPSNQTNPLDYPRYVRGIRPALPESIGVYVEDEFEKVQNSMENMAVASDANTKTQIEELSIQVGEDISAAITTEQTVRATADEALADQINTVVADYQSADGNLDAAITAEQIARADADSALADQITTVAATAGSAVFRQTTEPTGSTERPLKEGDLWYDTDDDNHPYIWDESTTSWVDNTDGRIPANSALITSEQIARADADTALAADITTVTTTVDGHTASITSLETTVDGIAAKAGVTLDVDGYVTGWELNNDGDTGDFIIRADHFAVVKPGDVSGVAPFEIIDGQVYIAGQHLAANSVLPDALNVTSLDAITATIGTLRTATSGARVEIHDNLIQVYDGSNVLRVRMGVW